MDGFSTVDVEPEVKWSNVLFKGGPTMDNYRYHTFIWVIVFGTLNFSCTWFTTQIPVLGKAHFLVIGRLLLASTGVTDDYNGSHAIVVKAVHCTYSCKVAGSLTRGTPVGVAVILLLHSQGIYLLFPFFKASIHRHASEWRTRQVSPAGCPDSGSWRAHPKDQ